MLQMQKDVKKLLSTKLSVLIAPAHVRSAAGPAATESERVYEGAA